MKKLILALFLLLIVGGGCSYLNSRFGMKDDNIVEESLESVLEAKTGLDIDFTPESPEGKSHGL